MADELVRDANKLGRTESSGPAHWPKLTDDVLDTVNGDRDELDSGY